MPHRRASLKQPPHSAQPLRTAFSAPARVDTGEQGWPHPCLRPKRGAVVIGQTPGVGCLLASWHMARPESGAAEQQGSSVPFWLGSLKLQDSLERRIRVTAAVRGCNHSLYIIKLCVIKPDHLVMLCGS